jgi:hypothetical protein
MYKPLGLGGIVLKASLGHACSKLGNTSNKVVKPGSLQGIRTFITNLVKSIQTKFSCTKPQTAFTTCHEHHILRYGGAPILRYEFAGFLLTVPAS